MFPVMAVCVFHPDIIDGSMFEDPHEHPSIPPPTRRLKLIVDPQKNEAMSMMTKHHLGDKSA